MVKCTYPRIAKYEERHFNGDYFLEVEEKVAVKKDNAVVTIELPSGNYLSKNFTDGATPQKVKDYIDQLFPDGWPKK